MKIADLPEHAQDIATAYPDVKIETSITIDPLLLDELKREIRFFPMARIMESKHFQTEMQAKTMVRHLLFLSRGGEQLARTEGELHWDQARDLVVQAFQSRICSERSELAKKALALSAQCAEAYIVLSMLEDDLDKQTDLLERAVGIASAQFDSSCFESPEDYFWQKLKTRPYMRCRAALAQALWAGGKQESALYQLKALLNLNPSDHQGLRFHLLSWLLEYNAGDSSIDEYFEMYEEERSAFGKFARALWHFVRYGNEKRSRNALQQALNANKFVPAFLCGVAKIPDFQSKRVVRGEVPEAVAYYQIGGRAWQKVDGAIAWLRESSGQLVSSKSILRKIESAKEYETAGTWAGPMPMELNIGRERVWF